MFQTDFVPRYSLLFALTLTGCQAMTPQQVSAPPTTSAPDEVSESLDSTYWHIKSLVGRDVSDELNASVAFRNNRLSGRAGCNYFFADYSEQKDHLHVEGMVTSKKICFAAVMQQEKLLLRALSAADRFEKNENGDLVIYSRRSDTPLVFRPISRAEMPVLAAR